MITKEYFVNTLQKIQEYDEALSNLPDWISFEEFPLSDFGYNLIDMLDKEMGTDDDKNGGLVFSWCYEHDFGTKYPDIQYKLDETGRVIKLDTLIPGCLVTIDGVNYAPKTAEELYDLATGTLKGGEDHGDK